MFRPVQKIKIPLCSIVNVLSAGIITLFLTKYAKWSLSLTKCKNHTNRALVEA